MATMTRGATVLTPVDVLGWSLSRPSRSVVHDLLGTDEVEVTVRPAGPRTGTLRTLWTDHTSALAAAAALAVPGGAWVVAVPERPGLSMTALVTGDVDESSLSDDGAGWAVDVTVTEV
ncbi:hypothetical protein ACTHAM_002415 [Cellulomonas soli]|uniref:hypothetical protein n=1 Tax=Cellulomonas soli TaxID=931535 RepID=UPI003F879EFD